MRMLAFALVLTGCFSEPGTITGDDAGSSSDESGSTSATSTTSSTTSPSSTDPTAATEPDTITGDDTSGCPEGAVDPPDVFAGWEGPAVLMAANPETDPPPCPLELGDDGVRGVNPQPQGCACTCTPSCRYDEHAGSSDCTISSGVNQNTLTPGVCNNVNAGFVNYHTASPAQAAGDCLTPVAVANQPIWDARYRVCVGPTDAMCVPRPPGAVGPCIRRVGDHLCPSPTAEKFVVYGDPTLTCGTCPSCIDEAYTACMGASITGYSDADCLGMSAGAFMDCSPIPVESVDYTPPVPACMPTTAVFESSMPTTYCCDP